MKPIISTSQATQKLLELEDAPIPVYVQFGKAKKDKRRGRRIIVNPLKGLMNTRNKLRQHQLLSEAGIRKPRFFVTHQEALAFMEETGTPVVAKRINHSKCRGMYRFNTPDELRNSQDRRVFTPDYYFEEFVRCNREWRIAVSRYHENEVIAYRKCLREEVEGEKPWFRNNDNCYFKLDSDGDKKAWWPEIIAECRRALEVLGMDIAAVDIGENTKVEGGAFYIYEFNSAPGMEENTRAAYAKAINEIIQIKLQK